MPPEQISKLRRLRCRSVIAKLSGRKGRKQIANTTSTKHAPGLSFNKPMLLTYTNEKHPYRIIRFHR